MPRERAGHGVTERARPVAEGAVVPGDPRMDHLDLRDRMADGDRHLAPSCVDVRAEGMVAGAGERQGQRRQEGNERGGTRNG